LLQQDNESTKYFDDLSDKIGDGSKPVKNESKEQLRRDYLVHRLFEQNEDGKELLTIWKEALMMTGLSSDVPVQIGIGEGKKQFIRNIILTIRRVENE